MWLTRKFLLSPDQEDPEVTEYKQEIQDDSNMSDAVRLSAPDMHKDYAVRRWAEQIKTLFKWT